MNPSLHIRVLTVFFLCLLNFIASAQQTPKWSDEGYFGYLEYLPSDYNDNENKKYPLLIFLHGQGEIGNGTSDIWKVARNGPPKHIQDGHDMTYTVNGETHKFLVISPQLAASSWQANFIDKVVEHAKKTYRVDENRIYLTGLSLGGSGVWNYAVTHPDKLAAIAAVCGPQNAQGLACNIADAKLPAWVFHGDADNTVGIYYSYNMVNAINSCNPAVPPIFTIYEGVGHAGAWQRAYKTNNELHTPNLYEWLLGKNRIRLIVEAGDDKTVNWPNNSVTLEGFVSYPSENIKSINWTKIEGPAATLSGVSSLQLSASNMSPGKYIFRLTIESTDNTQAFDDVSVEVVKSNLPPIANAGSDKTIELPVATTTLDGTGSYDEDGNITSYNWRQLDGPGGLTNKNILVNLTQNSLASGNWNNFSIRPLAGLSYKDLKDDEGISTGIDITFETNWGGTNELGSTTGDNSGVYSDNVMRGSYWISGGLHTIKVSGLDASSTYNFTFFGSRAGDGDRTTIYRIGEKEVTLNASNNSSETVSINYVSPSASGEIEIEISKTESALYGYLNALVIEGNPSNIVDPSSSQITLSGLEEGEYIYELEVVDNEGGKDTDEVKVTVLKGDEPVNNPPVADAGEDQIVVLPNNSISIDGSESRDPDGDGLTYKWEKTSGSDGITLLNTTSAILQVNDLSEGEYEFMLTVTDDKNTTEIDLVKITVLAESVNELPIANAGSNTSYTLPIAEILLDGSGSSDSDGEITGYKWMVSSAPTGYVLNNSESSQAILEVTTAGEYVLELAVTDDKGANSTDEVKVTVLPEPVNEVKNLTISYSYYEGIWSQLPDFESLNPIKTGKVSNIQLDERGRDDNFGFVFQSHIKIPKTGSYTFGTNSDDGSKLYIGGYDESNLVVDNDGLHGTIYREGIVELEAGIYPITITFFERGGNEVLEVYWKNTAHGITEKELIPNEAFCSDCLDTELEEETADKDYESGTISYSYYEGIWNQLPDFASLTPIKTGKISNIQLNERERDDSFGFVFKSYIKIPETGFYTFGISSDDGSKLYIGGYEEDNLIIDNDGSHGTISKENTIKLESGIYPIMLTYFDKWGREILELYWKNTAHGIVEKELIPDEVFVNNIQNLNYTDINQSIDTSGFDISINFTSTLDAESPWNNTGLPSQDLNISDLVDNEGNITDVSLNLVSDWNGGTNTSGMSQGIYPENIIKTAYWFNEQQIIDVNNLPIDYVYSFTFFSSRNGEGNRETKYIINTEEVYLDASLNEENIKEISGVVPNDNGTVSILMEKGEGALYGYINALEIHAIHKELYTEIKNSLIEFSDPYPNPVKDEISINITSSIESEISITVVDQMGVLLYSESSIQIPVGESIYQLSFSNITDKSGIYFINVATNSVHEIIKIIRE
ncbi:PKD domain-containing protein [Chondrinema litorale]|uniref:PKD domain-containing protein n=1 Tax=Chondrinema litorale TaxID=2994555 RepID=UPI002543A54B|nr:PA14 domain-containing protein [Chondrinema litorale]UZS00114.1 PA14 domain-containing protein [Chondrinema litorale]